MYLKVDNGMGYMETIFKTKDVKEMEEMEAKAKDLFPSRELVVTTNKN